MEQYNEQQKQLFIDFYQTCKSKGINPLESEADRQRALLLAKENQNLVSLFGEQLDGGHVEAYRMGMEIKETAEREAKIAAQRAKDQAAFALEQALSSKRGREKRLFFYQQVESSAIRAKISAQEAFDSALKLGAEITLASQQRESSWGTLGGIAAGITGSTAVGAAVAADTMNKNAGIRAHNEAIRQNVFQNLQPGMDASLQAAGRAEKRIKAIQRQMEKIKLTLVEERPLDDLMQELSFGAPQVAFTGGNTMIIRMAVQPKSEYKIAGSENAVIDGSFMAEVYEGEEKIGTAYLNFPLAGAEGPVTLKGHCLEAKPGGTYTILILPIALWLIERYVPENIPDLNDLIPGYATKHSWQPIPQRNIPWQKRLEEIRIEEERRAEEERQAEEARKRAEEARKKRKKKIIGIASLSAVVIAVAFILITTTAQKNDRYNMAVRLMERGDFVLAAKRFEELGDYKDSAEQLQQAQVLAPIADLADQGEYAEAIAQLEELGDEFALGANGLRSVIYQRAVDLLDTTCPQVAVERHTYYDAMEECHEMLQALSGYEDCDELLEDFYYTIIGTENGYNPDYYQYDRGGRLWDGQFYSCEYDDNGVMTEYRGLPVTDYDDNGRPIRSAYDDSSNTIEYNADGQLERSIWRQEGRNGSWNEQIQTYQYNENGEVIRLTSTYQDESGGTGSGLSNYDYNFIYTYDEAGNPLSYHTEDQDGNIISMEITYLYGWIYAPDLNRSEAG